MVWIAGSAALAITVWVGGVYWARRFAAERSKQRFISEAEQLAAALRPDLIRNIPFGTTGEVSLVYRRLQNYLRCWTDHLGASLLALIVERDGEIRLGPAAAVDGIPPAEYIHLVPSRGKLPDAAGLTVLSPRSVVALAPVRDPRTGEVLAAVAYAIPASLWSEEIRRISRWAHGFGAALVLVLAAGVAVFFWRSRQPHETALRWRHLETVLTVLVGAVLWLGASQLTLFLAGHEHRRQFERRAAEIAAMLRSAMRDIQTHVESLASFFEGSEAVTEGEFNVFAGPLVRNVPVELLFWAPRASVTNRSAPLSSAEQGRETATATGMSAPVGFVVPRDSQHEWTGTNLLAFATYSNALEAAHATGSSALSAPDPVLPFRMMVAAVRGRNEEPAGWVGAVVNLERMMAVLGSRIPGGVEPTAQLLALPAGKRRSDGVEIPMYWGGQVFALSFASPGRPTLMSSPMATALIVVETGLVALLGIVVGLFRSREERLEREVLAQTRTLREREEDLRITLESMAEGVLAAAADGRIMLMNSAAETMTGLPVAAALGRPLGEVFRVVLTFTGQPAEDIAALAIRHRKPASLSAEAALVRADGSWRRIAGTASPILPTADGRADGVVVVFRDVTEELRMRSELAESQERYRRLFNTMDDGFALHEMIFDDAGRPCDYRFLEVNPAFERQTGLKAAELIGRTLREVLPGTEEPWIAAYGRVVETGETMRFESSHAPTGRHYAVTAFRTAPGQFATLFYDITDRKRAAEEILRNRQLLHDILLSIQDGVCVLNKDLTIRFANDTVRRWFAPESPVEGGRCHEVFRCRTEPCDHCPTLRCLASGRPEHEVIPAPPGSEVEWLEIFSYPMRDPVSGEVTGAVEFIRDITAVRKAEEEHKRIERRMTEVQRLESLGVLAGGIAHDFNNILMAILGNADLAMQELPSGSSGRQHLMEIETASRRAAELCRQMLAYAGRGRFVVETFDLNRLIEEMVHLLKTTISKRVLLSLHLEPGLPFIRGDPSQLRQVVMNLVINAAEAIGDRSGTISITTGAATFDRAYLAAIGFERDLPEGLYITLEVADTGCGMDSKTLSRIFEPFFTTKFSGRGLGLSAVMGIVRGHRGAVKVYSEPGRGSLFKVLLPAVTEPTPDGPPLASPAEEWRGEGTILLVDDEESVRALCARMLERIGFEVLTAVDGIEAVELYRLNRDRIRCVILDLTMPQLNGEETFRRIRQIHPEARVILASGYSASELEERLAVKGFAAFLQKPYTTVDLVGQLRTVLAGGRPPSASSPC